MARFGLALSGGGFRATLFHLGVVRFLRDAGLLGNVTHIVSASGGSILAAHLALNWERYNGSAADFDAVASKIIDFVQLDVRNRIVRRLPLVYPLRLAQRLAGRRDSRRFISTGILERLYDEHLYHGKCVHELPEKPELHMLVTNLTEGCLGSFTRAGLVMQRRGTQAARLDVLPARLARISLAVATSSAFPGLFPPVQMSADELGLTASQFPNQLFTDGGVLDMFGLRVLVLLKDTIPQLDEIIASDAGGSFKILPSKPLGMIGQMMRATDILWNRVGDLEKSISEADPRFLFIRSAQLMDLMEDPTAVDPVIQPEIHTIRTDLDRFSPLEIRVLVQHGYCAARQQLRTKPDSFGKTLPPLPPWNPMAAPSSPREQLAGTPAVQAALPAPVGGVSADARLLRRSAERRIWSTLLDFRDWTSYLCLPILILLFVILPIQSWRFYWQARKDATVVEAITQSDPDFRKVLELVHQGRVRDFAPQEVKDQAEPTSIASQGYEFVSDTHIVDLRNWRPDKRDTAYYFRRLRVRKTGKDDRLVIQYVQPFNRVDFRCGPEKLKPAVHRVPARPGQRNVTWEVEFDFSDVQPGRVTEVTIEAHVHEVAAMAGKGETWLRYRPQVKTKDALVWLLFPEDRPYQHYSLTRYPVANPGPSEPIETRYTINHPYGSIIAWMVINPEVGYSYECQWTWQE
jgi:predicted acylesterase/phospholipase RssA